MGSRETGRRASWRVAIHDVIFGVESPAGRAFDVLLLWSILASVAAVMLESVESVRAQWGVALYVLEWFFTVVFTVEYGLRLVAVARPLRYARSFFGLVDLLAVLPTYLSLLFPGAQSLLVIRALRLLRIFRVLKLARYLGESNVLVSALQASRPKITVFLGGILSVALILGTLVYLVEGGEHGFTSIPRSLYWAIVTMTTVGYGDIAPQTVPGQTIAAFVMILGYAIIAVPTGIVSAEMAAARDRELDHSRLACHACGVADHAVDAQYCRRCGGTL
ncbi:MAG: ion transporter [Myxococcota bacterium]|nr:ion transporter [Myxococcota bacterium]